jgi:hypothetical protein
MVAWAMGVVAVAGVGLVVVGMRARPMAEPPLAASASVPELRASAAQPDPPQEPRHAEVLPVQAPAPVVRPASSSQADASVGVSAAPPPAAPAMVRHAPPPAPVVRPAPAASHGTVFDSRE